MTPASTGTPAPSYRASAIPVRRARRTAAEMDTIRHGLIHIVAAHRPVTVRQVFYQAVATGLVDKTEHSYRHTVARLLADLRRSGDINYYQIADSTRWMRKPTTYRDLGDALGRLHRTYRRELWIDQLDYLEVWLEKDALAGVIHEVTAELDIPLMVTRGYASLSFLHPAAETISAVGKPTYLYYLGDHDPSGVNIPVKVEQTLREMAPDTEIHFERIAVTVDQIEAWDLPTRPTKTTDTRSRTFVGRSVEVGAIPADDLRDLVRDAIEAHIDLDDLELTKQLEAGDREVLARMVETP